MKPKMTLTNPTDDELNAAVAEYVAGWTYQTFPNGACPHIKHWKNAKGEHTSIYMDGRFATSADAVLPLLEESGREWHCSRVRTDGRDYYEFYIGNINKGSYPTVVWHLPTFPRAACMALLWANGVEVVQ